MEAYSSVDSWLKFNMKNVKNNSYSMDADINNIYTNFSSLIQVLYFFILSYILVQYNSINLYKLKLFNIQFLQAKEEILNSNIPKETKKLNTPLNEIIGNTVTHTEEATNICMDTY